MSTVEEKELLYPLSTIYEGDGRNLPRVTRIPIEEIPEPFNGLLVHRNDMTPTLAAFHGCPIHLRVLKCIHEGAFYAREVVLEASATGKPVEYGAIQIFLENFPEASAQKVVEANTPLGYLLADLEHAHELPQFYVSLIPNQTMKDVFRLDSDPLLYARKNTISGKDGKVLAEVLEILPPVEA